ncbi:MAG: PPC domain-containing DNA-binding protein [Thermoplasmata archaeon]
MEYGQEGKIIVAKLDDGSDFFESLKEIMSEIDQDCGVLVTGIGMLRNFKLGYYNMESGEYEFEKYEKPMELVSVNGSITEDVSIHMHAELADEDHQVIGGHLKEAEVCNVNEITMIVFDELKMTKKYDKELDTDLLTVR